MTTDPRYTNAALEIISRHFICVRNLKRNNRADQGTPEQPTFQCSINWPIILRGEAYGGSPVYDPHVVSGIEERHLSTVLGGCWSV